MERGKISFYLVMLTSQKSEKHAWDMQGYLFSAAHLTPCIMCEKQGSYASWKPLKTLEFQESDFKALKVLEFRFQSLKVLDFLLNKIENPVKTNFQESKA